MARKHPLTPMKLWMAAATPAEQEQLALAAGTTRAGLYQVSSGNRRFRPGKAAALERASRTLHAANPALPLLYRTDLAVECASCEYAQACLGDIATRAEFPIIPIKKA